MTIENRLWQGENNFTLFKNSVPISQNEIWTAFYHLHRDKISIQKEAIATDKLKTIIRATFKLVDQKGFALMSLRDLSEESGISMGSLYTYIGSKGQLAEMIHQFLPHIFDICLVEQLNKEGEVKDQLNILIRGHIFITECLQPWFFFAFMETKHLSRSTKTLAKENELRSEKWLERFLKQGHKDGSFRLVDKFLTSMSIKSLLQNWYVKRGKYKQAKVSCEQYVDFIDQVVSRFIEN